MDYTVIQLSDTYTTKTNTTKTKSADYQVGDLDPR